MYKIHYTLYKIQNTVYRCIVQSRFILYRIPLRIFITHLYGIETLRLIILQKYGNVVRFTCYSSVLIFSFCFVNFRYLYLLLILNSTFFSEMSTKRILTPTAIKEMMISWHQKEKSFFFLKNFNWQFTISIHNIS